MRAVDIFGIAVAALIGLYTLTLEPWSRQWWGTVIVAGIVAVLALGHMILGDRLRESFSWGPWILIVGGPIIGCLWLFLNHQLATPGNNKQTDAPIVIPEKTELRPPLNPPVGVTQPPQIASTAPQILQRKYTSKEAQELISAISEVVAKIRNINSILNSVSNFTYGGRTKPSWSQYISDQGLPKTISTLRQFRKQFSAIVPDLNIIIDKYPDFSSELRNIIGSTNIFLDMDNATDRLIESTQALDNLGQDDLKIQIIYLSLQEPHRQFEQQFQKIREWVANFVNQRAPEARKEAAKSL